ncbi:MAG: hypothetical protein ACREVK_11245 [Gammaproteobacteria bacterium]
MRTVIDEAVAQALNNQTPSKFFGEAGLAELRAALANCEPDPTHLPEWIRFVVQSWEGFSRMQTYRDLAERLRQ